MTGSQSQYIWPPFPQPPFDAYASTAQASTSSVRRPFENLLDYDGPGPNNFDAFSTPHQDPFQFAEQGHHQGQPDSQSQTQKGKRKVSADDSEDDGPTQVQPRTRRGGPPRIPNPKGTHTEMYDSFRSVMDSLKIQIMSNPVDIDFNANFMVVNNPPISDKDRVKVLAHEIWRTTGFRFTIKDHPQLRDGHKTRYWCAQDESGRSRIKGPATADSKVRYPCRSSLLLASKCERPGDQPEYRLLTIRLHHHLAHDADPETPSSPDPIVTWDPPPPAIIRLAADSSEKTSSGGGGSRKKPKQSASSPRQIQAPPPPSYLNLAETGGFLSSIPPPPPFMSPSTSSAVQGGQQAPPVIPHPQPTLSASTSDPDIRMSHTKYQGKMRRHIRNIREFCDGLEYQLQFEDQRILTMIETQGKGFMDLVHECLRQEGRLVGEDNED